VEKLANWKIVTYALYLLDGATIPAHTEDIALKCFELAPGSFSWVKHPSYPDKDIVRVALTDAAKSKHGALVTGRSGTGRGRGAGKASPAMDGWQLTEAGVRWAVGNRTAVADALGDDAPSPHRQADLKKLAKLRRHEVFQRFLDHPQGFAPQLGELAEMMRCRVDASAHTWGKRIGTFRALAAFCKDGEVLDFLSQCEATLEDGTG